MCCPGIQDLCDRPCLQSLNFDISLLPHRFELLSVLTDLGSLFRQHGREFSIDLLQVADLVKSSAGSNLARSNHSLEHESSELPLQHCQVLYRPLRDRFQLAWTSQSTFDTSVGTLFPLERVVSIQ